MDAGRQNAASGAFKIAFKLAVSHQFIELGFANAKHLPSHLSRNGDRCQRRQARRLLTRFGLGKSLRHLLVQCKPAACCGSGANQELPDPIHRPAWPFPFAGNHRQLDVSKPLPRRAERSSAVVRKGIMAGEAGLFAQYSDHCAISFARFVKRSPRL